MSVTLPDIYRRNLNVLAIAVQTGQPVFIWGPPGHAKTSVVKMLGRALEWPVEIVLAQTYDPPDIIGWPKVMEVDGHSFVQRMPPRYAHKLSKESLGDSHAILFYDEMNTAPEACESACLRVVQEGVIGDVELGNVSIVGAGNNGNGGATNRPLGPAMASRFLHIKNFTLDEGMWGNALLEGFKDFQFPVLNKDWRDFYTMTAAVVRAWVIGTPGILKDDKNIEDKSDNYIYGYPNPRTMRNATYMLAACKASGLDDIEQKIAVGGLIGESYAQSLFEFIGKMDLPDPEELLRNPKGFVVPDAKKRDLIYVITTAVAGAYANNVTEARYNAALDIMAKIVDANHPKDSVIPAIMMITKSSGVDNIVAWFNKGKHKVHHAIDDIITECSAAQTKRKMNRR